MGDGIGRYRGTESKLAQWLRRRPKRTAADDGNTRETLLLAIAAAGLPLAPAAHPVGYSCSCERIGCPTPARHPLSFAWQTQSTTDRAQIERWVRNQPEANFITATGMVHDVLDVPLAAGRAALDRLLAEGVDVGPVAEFRDGAGDGGRMLFFTATRGTPEDEDEWWPCELDCHPETMDEHPGLRWHCRGSYVLVPPARLPGDEEDHPVVGWTRGPEHDLPDPLNLLETLTDACARHAAERGADGDDEHAAHGVAWPLTR
ncbi:bifunctional DNA primase/polymerase [Streptomyces sp. NPDC085466]|uniref:bifunctional DNA primase/polymerase n=1 Tax=Streptomyces sp. NPDC085466 TaxID=3365725 RepID=UPI0037D402ED